MTIHLPEDLERSIRSLVEGGRFESEDEAVAEAVRSFLRQDQTAATQPGPGSIGAMREAADDLDAAVEHAMMVREEPGRLGLDPALGKMLDLEPASGPRISLVDRV